MTMRKKSSILLLVWVLITLLAGMYITAAAEKALDETVRVARLMPPNPAESISTGDSAHAFRTRAMIAGVALLAATLLIGTVIVNGYTSLLRKIAFNLDELAGNIDGSSYTIKNTSLELSAGTRRQSVALAQSLAAHRVIAEQTHESADNAQQANSLIQESHRRIDATNRTMQALRASMEEIRQTGRKIETVIEQIETIASKTNMLALNASVEAARAGEAGNAFGVVAEEVRNLAKESADSSKRTNEMIDATVEQVNAGADTVIQVADGFTEITSQIEKARMAMSSIAEGAEKQAGQIHELNAAISELESLNRENERTADRSEMVSAKLQEQSEALRRFTGNIIGQINGNGRLRDSHINQVLTELQQLGSNLSAQPPEASAHRQSLTEWRQDKTGILDAIYSCRHDGTFIFSDPPAAIDNARIRPWWQKAMTGEPYMSPVYISAINRKPCCTLSIPLKNASGSVAGVLGADIKLS